jgi:uncharacterized protein YchJ
METKRPSETGGREISFCVGRLLNTRSFGFECQWKEVKSERVERFTSVFVKQNGKWQLISDHISRVPKQEQSATSTNKSQ